MDIKIIDKNVNIPKPIPLCLMEKILIGITNQNNVNVFSRSLSIICFNVVGAVLHIARIIPRKKPSKIPKITIFCKLFIIIFNFIF